MSFHFPPESAIVQYQLRLRDERLKTVIISKQFKMSALIGSIDQGTSSTRYVFLTTILNLFVFTITYFYLMERFMVFEAGSGQVVGQHQQEVKQLFPHER